MNTQINKDANIADTKIDIATEIAQENFEVEDINDLNLYAPLSVSLCSSSSTSSCSSCCS